MESTVQSPDEASRRRPGWTDAAAWIKLADGQRWAFPKPWVEVRPSFRGGKPAIASARTTHGPEFDEAVDLLKRAETNHDIIIATMILGAFLLRRQYDLTDEELESLFVFRFGDESLADESLAMVREIAAVATGRGDQDFRDGSG